MCSSDLRSPSRLRVRSTLDWVRRRGASQAPVRRPRHRSRSREASIAIGAKARSQSTARSREALIARSAQRRVRDLGLRSTALVLANGADWSLVRANSADWLCFSLSRSLSLSLSLSLRNSFEVKIGAEIHFRSQSLFFWVNGNQFPENSIFRTNQTLAFPEMIFTQNKHSLRFFKFEGLFG